MDRVRMGQALFVYGGLVAFIYVVIVLMSGPPVVPGSAGVAGLIWFSLVGQALGALLGYLAFIGWNSDIDFDIDEEKLFVVLPAAFLGGVYFPVFAYSFVVETNPALAMQEALGNTTAVRVVGFVALLIGMLGMIPMLVIVPVTAFLALIGIIKTIIYWSCRTPVVDALSSGEEFDFDAAIGDIQKRTEYQPPMLLHYMLPGVTNWYYDCREHWLLRVAATKRAGSKAMRTTIDAYKNAHGQKD